MYQTKPAMSTGGNANTLGRKRPNPVSGYRSGGFWRHHDLGDVIWVRWTWLGGLGFVDLGHMPHLAARPRRALAVKVDGGAWFRQPVLVAQDVVADQVGHGDRAMADGFTQRPSGDGADVLLE